MATILKTDGSHLPLDDMSLKSLQKAVGGLIEIVYLDEGKLLIINEEGKVSNLPYNAEATMLADRFIFPTDYISGDAVLCNSEELGEEKEEL